MTTHYAHEDDDRGIGIMSTTRTNPGPEDDRRYAESLTVNAFVSNYDDGTAFVGVSTHHELNKDQDPEQVTFYVDAKGAAELAEFFARIAGRVA
jgi:hypothetical protein